MRLLDEGKYQTIISAYSLKPSKKFEDELNLMLGFEIISGQNKGIIVYKFYAINPERIDTLKGDMQILGIDLEETGIRALGDPATADKILDLICDIQIKHKKRTDGNGVFQNVYLSKCLGKAEDNFMETDDDECPFD
jgi:hypothetical protein